MTASNTKTRRPARAKKTSSPKAEAVVQPQPHVDHCEAHWEQPHLKSLVRDAEVRFTISLGSKGLGMCQRFVTATARAHVALDPASIAFLAQVAANLIALRAEKEDVQDELIGVDGTDAAANSAQFPSDGSPGVELF